MHDIPTISCDSDCGKYNAKIYRDESSVFIVVTTSDDQRIQIQRIMPLTKFLKELGLFPTCLADIPPVEHV